MCWNKDWRSRPLTKTTKWSPMITPRWQLGTANSRSTPALNQRAPAHRPRRDQTQRSITRLIPRSSRWNAGLPRPRSARQIQTSIELADLEEAEQVTAAGGTQSRLS